MPASNAAGCAAFGVEGEQRLDVRVGHRPPVGAAGERRDESASRTTALVGTVPTDGRRRCGGGSACLWTPVALNGPLIVTVPMCGWYNR